LGLLENQSRAAEPQRKLVISVSLSLCGLSSGYFIVF
jgi:Sec-independent protein secretion pathway component TatC